jgi:hypothetical protein
MVIRKSPELTRYKHPMASVEVLVDIVRDMLTECVEDSVPRDVVRMADVVHLQLPVDLLDARHWSNTS